MNIDTGKPCFHGSPNTQIRESKRLLIRYPRRKRRKIISIIDASFSFSIGNNRLTDFSFLLLFCRGHATYKSPCRSVGRSVRRSVGPSVSPSHFAFFAFLGILRVGKFVFEHAPAQIITAPAQIIIAPAQIFITPAHCPRQEQSCKQPCLV